MMIKEAIEYLEKRKDPYIYEMYGDTYSDVALHRYNEIFPKTISTHTLHSIVEYINVEPEYIEGKFIIHIADASNVFLYEEAAGSQRRVIMHATPFASEIQYGHFLDIEQFNIMLQTCFIRTSDRDKVLSIVSNISDGHVKSHSDDGVTQTVTVRAGIQRVGAEVVPNPVNLKPYRTFIEVDQPESPFVLRIRQQQDDLPLAALFESGGDLWQLHAIENILTFFEGSLEKTSVILA